MVKDESTNEAPENHPDPKTWWKTIKWQSYMCLWSMILEGVALIYLGEITKYAETPLVILNLGFVAGFVSYNGGSAAIDLVKAWKSPSQ